MNGNNGNILDRCEVDKLMENVYMELNLTPKDVQITSGSNKGDGYLSFMTRVDATTEEGKDIHVIIKSAPRIDDLREMAPIHEAYLREIYFYERIVPEFHKFQTVQHSLREPFNAAIKYYHSCKEDGKESLVMENIKMNGFSLWNRKKLMNHEHIELVLRTYGKFHAVSYAMQKQNPECYESMKKQLPDIFTVDNVNESMFTVFQNCANKVKELFKDENQEIYDKMGAYSHGIVDFWRFMELNAGDHPVICHGDCWVNNMMFKYEDLENPKKPTDIRLCDFQILKIGSPVMDLSYFFYVSAPKHILHQFDKYLHIYHDSLCQSLKEMNVHENVMSYEGLKKEWKRFAKFGFTMALGVSKVMMAEDEEIVDFSDCAAIDAMNTLFMQDLKNDEFINNKLKLLAQHMYDNHFL